MKKLRHTFFLLLLTAALTSCGFHLQGKKELAPPFHRLYLQTTDPYGPLAKSLQDYLKISEVELLPSPENADTILVILQDEASQILLAPSGTLQTRQYQLVVTVAFEITDKQGRVLVPQQALTESRPITIQSNQILGSSNDVNLYYQQMRRVLAYAIMNRLASTEISKMVTQAYSAEVSLVKIKK